MSFKNPFAKRSVSNPPSDGTQLRLYDMKYCYFCNLVRQTATRLGIRLELVDVLSDTDARSLLMSKLGRSTVPVLGIPTSEGEKLLPESADIIDYLENLKP